MRVDDLGAYRRHVALTEPAGGAGRTDAADVRRRRQNVTDRGPEALDHTLDARARAGADADHDDQGGNPHDDAERRQEAAEPVRAKRPQRDEEAIDQLHAAAPRRTGRRATAAAASSGDGTCSSLTSSPSRKYNTRPA